MPKRKGRRAARAGPEEEAVVAPVPDGLDRAKLALQLQALNEQLEQAMAARNFAQLECETTKTCYDTTRGEVRALEEAIVAKDREIEAMEEHHRVEVRVYQQKMKHLEHEHGNGLEEARAERAAHLAREASASGERRRRLQGEKRGGRAALRAAVTGNGREIELAQQNIEKNVRKVREGLDERLNALRGHCEARLERLRSDLALRRKVDVHEVEERKNRHIHELARNHEAAFRQMKQYYNRITRDNLELIQALRGQAAELKGRAEASRGEMRAKAQESRDLRRPLELRLGKVRELEAQLRDRRKDAFTLRNARARSRKLQEQLAALEGRHEARRANLQRVEAERDSLHSGFEDAIREVQRRSAARSTALERSIARADGDLSRTKAQVAQVVEAGALDAEEVARLTTGIGDLLEARSSTVRDLRYQVTRAAKRYNDTLRTLAARMARAGVPAGALEAMGIGPLGTGASVGPAGLVASA